MSRTIMTFLIADLITAISLRRCHCIGKPKRGQGSNEFTTRWCLGSRQPQSRREPRIQCRRPETVSVPFAALVEAPGTAPDVVSSSSTYEIPKVPILKRIAEAAPGKQIIEARVAKEDPAFHSEAPRLEPFLSTSPLIFGHLQDDASLLRHSPSRAKHILDESTTHQPREQRQRRRDIQQDDGDLCHLWVKEGKGFEDFGAAR